MCARSTLTECMIFPRKLFGRRVTGVTPTQVSSLAELQLYPELERSGAHY